MISPATLLQPLRGAPNATGVSFSCAGLLAFDPSTGQEDFYLPWRASILESVNASTPIVWDQHVFISETYGPGSALLAFRPGAYDILWSDAERRRDKSLQTHWNTPIYHQGFLYASSGRHTQNANLRCVDAMSGKVMWSQPDLTRCSLLYADDHLICLSEYGTLRVIKASPTAYQEISASTPVDERADGRRTPLLNYPAWAAPMLAQGRLYVRGKDHLACYELPRKN